jgi:hypothetical protein
VAIFLSARRGEFVFLSKDFAIAPRRGPLSLATVAKLLYQAEGSGVVLATELTSGSCHLDQQSRGHVDSRTDCGPQTAWCCKGNISAVNRPSRLFVYIISEIDINPMFSLCFY